MNVAISGPFDFPITQLSAFPRSFASGETGDATLSLIRLFVLLVGITALVTVLANRINLPYTLALVVFGLAAGATFAPLRVELTPSSSSSCCCRR